MSVTKIIQKQSIRPRKLKYTMANADSIEMAILPTATVDRHDRAVEQHAAHVRLAPCLHVVVEHVGRRQEPGRPRDDLLQILGGDHEGVVQGEGHHGDAGQEQRVDDHGVPVGGPPAADDHARLGQPGGLDGSGADGAHE